MKFKGITNILIVVLFVSCDTIGSYDYYIENKSDSTLTISYGWLSKLETKKVQPHSVLRIDTLETNNGLTDLKERFLSDYFDTLYLQINNSFIKKDINSRSDWEYSQEKRNHKNIYRFIVNNQDVK